MANKCLQCNKQKPYPYATFCWNCGAAYNGGYRYESSLAIAQPATQQRRPAAYDMPARVMLLWSGIISGAGYLATLALGVNAAWSFAPIFIIAGSAFAPPVISAMADWKQAKPLPTPGSELSTLVIENVDRDHPHGPKIAFNEAPHGVMLSDLQLVARWVLPFPVGKGQRFSKSNCKEMGLSQPKHKKMLDWFLDSGYVQWQGGSKHNGVEWTYEGKRLLVKSLKPMG